MRPRLGSTMLPLVVLAALACACFARLAAAPSALIMDGARPSVDHANRGDPRPVGNDTTFVFLPRHLQVARTLREFGHVPAWDASGFGGRPLAGNPQAGLFYPPIWLFWTFPAPALLGWLTVAHLVWGGIGTYLLARSQGLGRWPATVAAGVFQASPYLLAQTFEGHAPHVWSACWFPWAFWAYLDLRAGRRRGLVRLPPILALSALAGHPQEWFLLVLALSIWAGADALLLAPRSGRAAARPVLGWAVALALCLGLVAIDLLPMLDALPWTARGVAGEPNPGPPRNYVVHLGSLLQLLSPRALGGPADFTGPDNYWESVLSFGLVPLLLISAGAVAIARGRSGREPIPRSARGWTVLAVASAWFAVGPNLGLFTAFHRLVPGMASFRVPARSLFLATLAGAMLAGFGTHELMHRYVCVLKWRRFAARLALMAGLLLGGLGVAILASGGDASPAHPEPSSARNTWGLGPAAGRILLDPAFGSVLAALVATTALGCFLRRGPASHAIGVLALVELAAQGQLLLRVTPADDVLGHDPIAAAILAAPPDPAGAPPRLRARDSLYLDLQAVRHGLEKTNVNDVFQLGHAAALYEQLYAVASTRHPLPRASFHMSTPEEQRRIRQAVFDRMAVAFLVSDRFEDDPGWPRLVTGRLPDGRPYTIQRNPGALPRAYVVPRAEVAADDAPAILKKFADSDPRHAVLMATDPLASTPSDHRQPFTPARWVGRDPDRPSIEVNTTAPGLLVVADTWMPGWSARLDGRPVPVLRGNLAQRVIPLPGPGVHHVDLEYHPPGLATGLCITIGSLAAWLLLAAIAHPSRRRPHPSAAARNAVAIRAFRVEATSVPRSRSTQI